MSIQPTSSLQLINRRLRDLFSPKIRLRLRAPIHTKIRRSHSRPKRPPQRENPTSQRSHERPPALVQLEAVHESARGGAVGRVRGGAEEEEELAWNDVFKGDEPETVFGKEEEDAPESSAEGQTLSAVAFMLILTPCFSSR